MAGRPPKPGHLRILEGNRGKRVVKDEPHAEAATPTTLSPPSYLAKDERLAYRQLAGDVAKLGVLQVVDRTALELAAVHLARVRRGETVVDSTRLVAHFLANCGLTPAARVKLGTLPTRRESGGDVPEELRETAVGRGA